jgi:PAS domain S-box-containing protein
MVNLNRIFLWLSIRAKLLIAFAGLSILPLTLVGIYIIFSNMRTIEETEITKLTDDVRTIKEKAGNFLEDVSSDLRMLQNFSSVNSWVRKMDAGSLPRRSDNLTRVATELLAFAQTKGIYYQFRLLGMDGDELVRVECDDPNSTQKTFHVVSSEELHHGTERFYFLLMNNAAPNQISFVPAEVLYHDKQQVPVLSFIIPLVENRQRMGLLIANVFEKDFIGVIESKKQYEPSHQVILAMGDGHYLYHSGKKKDWNSLLAFREEDNVQRDYPAEIASSILSGTEGTVAKGTNDIIAYAPLFTLDKENLNTHPVPAFNTHIIVIESVSEQVVMGPVRSLTFLLIVLFFLILGSAIILGLIATNQFTKPIAELQRGSEIIAGGNYGYRLHVQTHDEIEKLADQFNVMAAALESHDQEILQHRTNLEDLVHKRSTELYEEKAKLQALLDNVPSAFVLLDMDFRIQTVSAAFTSVTGIFPDRVNGKRLQECEKPFCQGSERPWEAAAQSGMIEASIIKDESEGKLERYLEFIAVPQKKNGSVHAIILLITDISKRKKLEQQLVQTEKLSAAGEISSIIAHEFRNALTSIKMILQLMAESSHIIRTEKKSLAVALDSIYHMESIVTELLEFARPKPIHLTKANLNNVIAESIRFVTPHLQEQNIAITSTLDPRVPSFLIDESQCKESIINLLLNAIQAINISTTDRKNGKVTITSKRVLLNQNIDNVTVGNNIDTVRERTFENEIVLAKGTECIQIEIKDNGCGISDVIMKRIFDPFYTTKTNGTGLGLPMVKRTVESHHGVLKVTSIQKKGTVFTLFIPVHHDHQTK